MKKSLFLSAVVLSLGMLMVGCGTDSLTGADMTDLSKGTLAKGGGDMPPPAPVITTVPLVTIQRKQVGTVSVWNDNAKLYVKVDVDSGRQIATSALALETSLALIPQSRGGILKPGQFDYKRVYKPLVQSDTYEFDLVWEGGTELFISMYTTLGSPIYHPRTKKLLGYRPSFAWTAGSGFPDKKYDKYFTDIIDKSIIIIIK